MKILAASGLVMMLAAGAQAAPVCIPGSDSANAVSLAGTALHYCFGEDKARVCVATDVKTGATGAAPEVPVATAGPKVDTADDHITVCQADGKTCRDFKPKFRIDEGLGMYAEVNAAGTVAAAYSLERVETYDVKTGKRLASFKSGKQSCTRIYFAGDSIVVDNSDCGDAQVGQTYLATPKGKRIAWVGGGKALAAGTRPVAVADTKWAFVSETGDKLWIQDVKTGKVDRTVALGPATTDIVTLAASSTHVAVIYSGARAGDIAVVDVAAGTVASFPGNRCKRK